jgi:hypothetical protein
MDYRMLIRGLLIVFSYASVGKDLSTLVIEAKNFLELLNSHSSMYILSNKGAEFDEILKTFYHFI